VGHHHWTKHHHTIGAALAQGAVTMAAVSMNTKQGVDLALKATGDRGGDLTSTLTPGQVVWTSPDPLLSLAVDATGLLARALATGVEGSTTVTATVSLADGRVLEATVDVTVVAVPEVIASVEIDAGIPFDQ
jgi:hypothetical protein